MKHLFSARHGSYDSNSRLSSAGKEQIKRLADDFSLIMEKQSMHLVSSTAPRALDSAEVIANYFGLSDFDREGYLWSADDAPRELPSYNWDISSDGNLKLLAIIESRKDLADGLIVVSHLGVAESLALGVANNYNINLNSGELNNGTAIHLSLENKLFRLLPFGSQYLPNNFSF